MDALINVFIYSVLGMLALAVVLCVGSLVVAVVTAVVSIAVPLVVIIGIGLIGHKILEGC